MAREYTAESLLNCNRISHNHRLEDAGIHPIGIGVKVVTKKVRQDQMKCP